ncbi:hypothetical protein SORBI_3006G117900 [Sorghum bicolor]|uniref:BRX domain-containing protein n=1 Tax=Sorghum bicolor TaxID=4558 RepID=A0A1Z5REB1_SORBI|nr:hypothetical protein SORBI_3006G117900 [Sorghum bicolor]
MHACFHGGGGGGNSSRITKSVGFIAKSMKALSLLKVKTAGGGEGEGHPRAPRRRRQRRHRRRSPEAEELQDKDVAAASSSASSSAKIAPAAQPHEAAADGDHRKDRLHQDEERGQGGAKHEHCDKCCSPLDDGGGGGDEEEAAEGTADAASDGEWAAEPEPGVLMTLVPRGDGANYLRRIRFSEEYFGDAWAAQTWWADNCDRIVELYSVVVQPQDGENDDDDDPAAPVTPCQSEDDEHHQLQVHDRIRSDSIWLGFPLFLNSDRSRCGVGWPVATYLHRTQQLLARYDSKAIKRFAISS